MGWEQRALVRDSQLPARVQISRVSDWPCIVLYRRGERHGDHVRSRPLVVGGFVPRDVVHGVWPTEYLYVSPPEPAQRAY